MRVLDAAALIAGAAVCTAILPVSVPVTSLFLAVASLPGIEPAPTGLHRP
jgi:hypothetical protein